MSQVVRRLGTFTRWGVPSFRSRILKVTTPSKPCYKRKLVVLENVLENKNNLFPPLHLTRTMHSSKVLQKEVIPFKLSDIGEGIKEVTIKEWFVKVGDRVAQFDQICEVQSDKASVTITSRYDGIVTKIYHKIDEIALVGSPLVDIEVQREGKLSEGLEEVQEGDAIQVGTVEDNLTLPSSSFFSSSSSSSSSSGDKPLATPAVRRIAAEHKVELKNVEGTGRDGRVLKEDILAYVHTTSNKGFKSPAPTTSKRSLPTPTPTPTPSPQPPTAKAIPPPAKPTSSPLPDRREPIRGYTKTMIKTMSAANEIPHFGYCDEINVARILRLRKELKSVAENYNVKLTLMPLFMKAASLALSKYPIINSTLDLANDSIVLKGSHNIGIAMDTKLGLVVPNVKNVESKSILEIALDLQNLSQSGSAGAFKPDDLRGGTFTISNIGSIGGTYAKPVILPPEVAIVAMGKTQVVPRYHVREEEEEEVEEDGRRKSGGGGGGFILQPTTIINVSFSADHRVMDGATVARFCNLWKSYLENPSSMLLYLR